MRLGGRSSELDVFLPFTEFDLEGALDDSLDPLKDFLLFIESDLEGGLDVLYSIFVKSLCDDELDIFPGSKDEVDDFLPFIELDLEGIFVVFSGYVRINMMNTKTKTVGLPEITLEMNQGSFDKLLFAINHVWKNESRTSLSFPRILIKPITPKEEPPSSNGVILDAGGRWG